MTKLKYDGKVQLDRTLFNRFKKHYPHHGSFSHVMRTLLIAHLDELEAQNAIN